jgi:hypothetical protein
MLLHNIVAMLKAIIKMGVVFNNWAGFTTFMTYSSSVQGALIMLVRRSSQLVSGNTVFLKFINIIIIIPSIALKKAYQLKRVQFSLHRQTHPPRLD